MPNQQMTLSGYSWKDNSPNKSLTPTSITVAQPFSDPDIETSGMPITLEAFLKMFKKFLDREPVPGEIINNIYAFSINKASLLRILSQEGCEILGFYFVITDNGNDLSLAIAGKDKDNKLIQKQSVDKMAEEIDNNQNITPLSFDLMPLVDEKVGKSKSEIRSLRETIELKWRAEETFTLQDLVKEL